jgi:uncharacterized protein
MDTVTLITFQIIILGVMLFGLVGMLTYIIPGLVIIWLAALVYGLAVGFHLVSWIIFGLLTILMIGGGLIDNVMMGAKARQTGASWVAVAVSLVAGLVGAIIFPPFGGVIGALLAIFVVELIRLRSWRPALVSTRSMAVGCGWATLIRLGIGGLMIILWGVWALWV